MAGFNLYRDGIANGWSVTDAAALERDLTLEADVVVIGTGAGGGTTAEILAKAGLKVILVEEGRLYDDRDFKMNELEAYGRLYQEGMSRATDDGAISILQGRSVGGSTTVNWTSSFRTPPETLNFWQERFGIENTSRDDMAPWFSNQEARMSIAPWAAPANANNAALSQGCEALGWEWGVIPRNVKGCWDIGYCGMGCPVNAKQSALVTTVPGALEASAQLIHCLRAERLIHDGTTVVQLEGVALDDHALNPTGQRVFISARHYVVAASALGSPALLLRSQVPDPHKRIGKRTFIHPVNATVARMPEEVAPYHGAPQSVYSDHFLWRDGVEGQIGYKLEVPPLHPAMVSAVLPDHGTAMHEQMLEFPYSQSMIALHRDGFSDDSTGGTVTLGDDGMPRLNYPVSDALWDAMRHAYLHMAELQFAVGAKRVRAVHMDSPFWDSWQEAQAGIKALPMAPHRARLFTAHQMGGCTMGGDPRESVVNSYGEHHQLENLNIHDASVFPTSLGVNPQLSIFALTARNSHRLASRLTA